MASVADGDRAARHPALLEVALVVVLGRPELRLDSPEASGREGRLLAVLCVGHFPTVRLVVWSSGHLSEHPGRPVVPGLAVASPPTCPISERSNDGDGRAGPRRGGRSPPARAAEDSSCPCVA